MTVEDKIKKYVDQKGVPQKELSKGTGISEAKISLSFKNKRKLTFDDYECICGFLDVPVDKFLTPRRPT